MGPLKPVAAPWRTSLWASERIQQTMRARIVLAQEVPLPLTGSGTGLRGVPSRRWLCYTTSTTGAVVPISLTVSGLIATEWDSHRVAAEYAWITNA